MHACATIPKKAFINEVGDLDFSGISEIRQAASSSRARMRGGGGALHYAGKLLRRLKERRSHS